MADREYTDTEKAYLDIRQASLALGAVEHRDDLDPEIREQLQAVREHLYAAMNDLELI